MSAGRVKDRKLTQQQRDLQRYADRWNCPMARVSAHSVRSRQMAAQMREQG